MSSSGWLGQVFATAMLAAAIYHGVRLSRAGLAHRAAESVVDLAQTGTGLVMIVMLVDHDGNPAGVPLASLFAVLTVWSAWRALRAPAPERVALAVSAGAMVYLLAPPTRWESTVDRVVLLVALGVTTAWLLRAVAPARRPAAAAPGPAPAGSVICQVLMSGTTIYMLAGAR
jgi:hypothetical protein